MHLVCSSLLSLGNFATNDNAEASVAAADERPDLDAIVRA
jgi:hypothetical protein